MPRSPAEGTRRGDFDACHARKETTERRSPLTRAPRLSRVGRRLGMTLSRSPNGNISFCRSFPCGGLQGASACTEGNAGPADAHAAPTLPPSSPLRSSSTLPRLYCSAGPIGRLAIGGHGCRRSRWEPVPRRLAPRAPGPRHPPPVHRLDRHERVEHAVADLAEGRAAGAAGPGGWMAHRRSLNLRQWLAQYSGSRSGSTGTHHEQAPRCCSG